MTIKGDATNLSAHYKLFNGETEIKAGEIKIPSFENKRGIAMFTSWKTALADFLQQYDAVVASSRRDRACPVSSAQTLPRKPYHTATGRGNDVVDHLQPRKKKNQTVQKTTMLYITQLIYIREGQETVFDQFEDIAIPAILKYNGRLLLRVRLSESSFIEHHIDKPYEIHLAEFATEQDFENFKQDEERRKFLHLKEQSIKSVLLIKGTKL